MNHSMQLTRRLSNEHPHRQCSSIEFRPSQLKQRFSVLFFCVATSLCAMWTEEPKDLLKGVDWKNVGGDVSNQSTSTTAPVTKKRLPKKIRQVPEYYFLPRRSLPSAIAVYGSIIAAGVGAGMLVEIWINKKIAEDGGVIWELDK